LLIATSRADDMSELKNLLRETEWELIGVSDLEHAAAALAAAKLPILLFDRDSAGAGWPAAIKQLIETRRSACVVLLSNVCDQYLWDEVVQHGGFDVLARPFRKERVLSTLTFAAMHCRTPWPKTAN